jgi:hypothetical protein
MAEQSRLEKEREIQRKIIEKETKKAISESKREDLKERKQISDDLLNEKVDRYLDLVEQKGEKDYLVQMLATILELCIPMKELSDQLFEMAEMVDFLGEILDYMDESMENMDDIFSANYNSYGFFARLKKKQHMKKFTKGLKNRMKGVQQQVSSIKGMTSEMKKSVMDISKIFDPAKPKKKQKEVEGAAMSPAVQSIVNARRLARGEDISSVSNNTPNEPSDIDGLI